MLHRAEPGTPYYFVELTPALLNIINLIIIKIQYQNSKLVRLLITLSYLTELRSAISVSLT